MEFDKSLNDLTPLELVELAEKWQEGEETRSIVIIATDGDDAEDAADIANLVGGNKRDLVLALADVIYQNPEIFRLANKLAEVLKEKGTDLEGLQNGE